MFLTKFKKRHVVPFLCHYKIIDNIIIENVVLRLKKVILTNLYGSKWSTIWGPKGWLNN